MGELGTSLGKSFQDQPLSTVYVGPGAGEYGAFQPGSGIAMSYDDLKVVECYNFLRSVAEGRPHGATIEDALRAAEVLEAALTSADNGTWAPVAQVGPA
jgi:predicted dehydrogenase